MFQKSPSYPAVLEKEIKYTPDDVDTVVGPSVKVEGDFASEGNIIVKGTVTGSVKTSKMLTVETGAKIFANVRADNAIVSGSIKGNVKVNERLELTETAQVSGDIDCKVLSVTPGALILGKVSMKGISLPEEPEKTEKRKIFGKVKSDDNEVVPNL